MPKSRLKLPPLLFGHMQAKVDFDVLNMQSTVNSLTNWVSEFDSLSAQDSFEHRITAMSSGGVRMITVASTPTVMKVNDPDYTIAIPITGSFKSWVQGRQFEVAQGNQGIFYPVGKRHTEGGNKSVLLISVSPVKLRKTISNLLGEERARLVRLDEPRLIQLDHGRVNLKTMAIQFCSLLNQTGLDPLVTETFGIDDAVSRMFVSMLEPSVLLPQNLPAGLGAYPPALDLICEYIDANLGQPLHMEILERVSGLSARTIQLYFKERFQCSPTGWISAKRMQKAQQLLMNPDALTTVSDVALQCGYSNFSLFAKRYSEVNNELPSITLSRALKKA